MFLRETKNLEEAYEPPSNPSDSTTDSDTADARVTPRTRRQDPFHGIFGTSSGDGSEAESTPLCRLTRAGVHLDHDNINTLDSSTPTDTTAKPPPPKRGRLNVRHLCADPDCGCRQLHHLLPQRQKLQRTAYVPHCQQRSFCSTRARFDIRIAPSDIHDHHPHADGPVAATPASQQRQPRRLI